MNFIPQIEIPTLMINGRNDFVFPLESAQKPMFELLGTAPEHKSHIVYEGDHYQITSSAVSRDLAQWLDKYLGPL